MLSDIYLELGKHQKALKLATRYINCEENETSFCIQKCYNLINVAKCLMHLGKFDECLSTLTYFFNTASPFKQPGESTFGFPSLEPLSLYISCLLQQLEESCKANSALDTNETLDKLQDCVVDNFRSFCITAASYWAFEDSGRFSSARECYLSN
ncbi:MAG: hypothetical protein MHMPM18_004758 [Marteilia pararefringens]